MKPIQNFIIDSWNEGKDVNWIVSRLSHNYANPLQLVTEYLIGLLAGAQDMPGFPLMRKRDM